MAGGVCLFRSRPAKGEGETARGSARARSSPRTQQPAGGGHLKIQPWDAKKKEADEKKLLSFSAVVSCSAYTVWLASNPYTCGQPAPYIFAPEERQNRRRLEPQGNLIDCIVKRSYPTPLSSQPSVRSVYR
jgi:hypothetical protein